MQTYFLPQEWLSRPINIVLVGCGGTGSEMLDELFRIHTLLIALDGFGLDVHVFDPDKVSAANIGRQRFLQCDIGHMKSEVLVTRLNSYGGTQWRYSTEPYASSLTGIDYDVIITCVDNAELRADIGASENCEEKYSSHWSRRESLWLDCGNDSHSGNVILGHIEPGESSIRLPNVFDLYPILAAMEESNEPSCSTAEALTRQDYGINRSIAREGANLLWQLLRHGELNHHGSYINIREGSVTPLKIDKEVWATFNS